MLPRYVQLKSQLRLRMDRIVNIKKPKSNEFFKNANIPPLIFLQNINGLASTISHGKC